MKRILLIAALLVSATLTAQERITLSAPEIVPSNVNYRVERRILEDDNPATPADEGQITIQLIGVERPTAVTCIYNANTSPTGTFLLNGLNKANLSLPYAGNATSGTFIQRIFHRLVVMGESSAVCNKTLSGSLAGVPQ